MNWRNLDDSLEDKAYMAPHVLAMSATPIPRTLALALFGDMSLTQVQISLLAFYMHIINGIIHDYLRIEVEWFVLPNT